MKKLLGLVVSTLILAFGIIPITAAPASAAVDDPCVGSIVLYGRTSVSEAALYYTAGSKGGTNCVRLNHLGAAYGKSALTSVYLTLCTQKSPAATCTFAGSAVGDNGYYSYYAGPRHIDGTKGRCIGSWGRIVWNGTETKHWTSYGGKGSYGHPSATNCG